MSERGVHDHLLVHCGLQDLGLTAERGGRREQERVGLDGLGQQGFLTPNKPFHQSQLDPRRNVRAPSEAGSMA